MDIRDYFSRKRTSSEETDSHRDQEASGDAQSLTQTTVDDEEHQQPQKKKAASYSMWKEENLQGKAFLQKSVGKEISLGHL